MEKQDRIYREERLFVGGGGEVKAGEIRWREKQGEKRD